MAKGSLTEELREVMTEGEVEAFEALAETSWMRGRPGESASTYTPNIEKVLDTAAQRFREIARQLTYTEQGIDALLRMEKSGKWVVNKESKKLLLEVKATINAMNKAYNKGAPTMKLGKLMGLGDVSFKQAREMEPWHQR
jgi:hypothetical protein